MVLLALLVVGCWLMVVGLVGCCCYVSRPALSCRNLFLNAPIWDGSHDNRWPKSCTRPPAHVRVLLGCSGCAANGWRAIAPQSSLPIAFTTRFHSSGVHVSRLALACCNLSLNASCCDTLHARRWPQSCTRPPASVRVLLGCSSCAANGWLNGTSCSANGWLKSAIVFLNARFTH